MIPIETEQINFNEEDQDAITNIYREYVQKLKLPSFKTDLMLIKLKKELLSRILYPYYISIKIFLYLKNLIYHPCIPSLFFSCFFFLFFFKNNFSNDLKEVKKLSAECLGMLPKRIILNDLISKIEENNELSIGFVSLLLLYQYNFVIYFSI